MRGLSHFGGCLGRGGCMGNAFGLSFVAQTHTSLRGKEKLNISDDKINQNNFRSTGRPANGRARESLKPMPLVALVCWVTALILVPKFERKWCGYT